MLALTVYRWGRQKKIILPRSVIVTYVTWSHDLIPLIGLTEWCRVDWVWAVNLLPLVPDISQALISTRVFIGDTTSRLDDHSRLHVALLRLISFTFNEAQLLFPLQAELQFAEELTDLMTEEWPRILLFHWNPPYHFNGAKHSNSLRLKLKC